MIETESQGAVDVLTPHGPLNAEHCGSFTDKLAAVAPGAVPQVVVNLSETPLIDGQGLESLLDARDAARRRGGAIKLAAATPLAADVLHATGVGGYFESFGDVRSAVGSFGR